MSGIYSPLAYCRQWGTVEQALEDLAMWQQRQIAHGFGVTALTKVSDGWLVTACPELTEATIGF